jgi:protein-disulfide isomerase
MQKIIDGALVVALLATFAIMLFVLDQPGSPARRRYDAFVVGRARRATMRAEWDSILASGGTLGKVGPTVVEFSDYECPFCRATEPLLDSLRRAGVVRVSYHQFPLAIHPLAKGASLAAICARQQGVFEGVHHRLMTTTDWQRDSNWVALAVASGLPDSVRFKQCLRSSEAAALLNTDMRLGTSLRVSGTPTFLTHQNSIDGALHGADVPTLLAGR